MFFPVAYILAFLALLFTPVLSVPIHYQHSVDTHHPHPVVDQPSVPWGYPQHREAAVVERDLPAYADILACDESSILEARSFDNMERPLAKRDIQRLVRRKSIFTKMKEGFKAGNGNR